MLFNNLEKVGANIARVGSVDPVANFPSFEKAWEETAQRTLDNAVTAFSLGIDVISEAKKKIQMANDSIQQSLAVIRKLKGDGYVVSLPDDCQYVIRERVTAYDSKGEAITTIAYYKKGD